MSNYLINKKKKRNSSTKKTFTEMDKPRKIEKKFLSAESKKISESNLKEINYFISKIEPKHENIKFREEDRLSGDKLNFELRRKEADRLINDKNNNNDELENIINALNYDNTNKICIYKLLNYYYKKELKQKYNEALDKYKFCITKKFIIEEEGKKIDVNLNDLYKINLPIEELEELPNNKTNDNGPIIDLRNSLVEFFTSYYYISKCMSQIENVIKKEEDIKEIITIKYKSSVKGIYSLDYERSKKEEIISKYNEKTNNKSEEDKEKNKFDEKLLLDSIENFLCKYIFYQSFILFQMNQPINYAHNLTLYYNYIIWSLYNITIGVDELNNKIFFREKKLYSYNKLNEFHDLLFDNFFDKAVPFNETMNQLLQFLLLSLSVNRSIFLDYIHKNIHLPNKVSFIDAHYVDNFLKSLNKEYKFLNAEFDKNKKDIIKFNEDENMDCHKITIKFENYTKDIKFCDDINWLWKNINFEKFQLTNFFLKEDLDYLKYLIKHILSSKLFKQIYKVFNNVSEVTDYYFNVSENIDDYIKKIIFLPFGVNDLGIFAKTDRRMLYVFAAGYPETTICNFDVYRINRILELALRNIILGYHMPIHFIKSSNSLLTEGIISRNTSNEDKTIGGGFFYEKVLFGWKRKEEKPLDLIGLKLLKKEIECNNDALREKKIDLVTALNLLNPKIYNYDLEYFRNSLFNLSQNDLKNFDFSSSDNVEYITYIKSVIGVEKIKKFWDNDFLVDASMGIYDGMSISYFNYNHNLLGFK